MKARATGNLTISSEGNVASEKFSIAATSNVLSGGSLTLTVRPGFNPSLNAKDAAGSNLLDAGAYTGLANVSDFDINIAKGGVDIAGQSCDLALDVQNVGAKSGANRLTINTNVEQVGDVSVTLSQAGYIDRAKNDAVAKANEAQVNVNLNKFASDVNADLTANVDYEVASKDAALNLGFKNGDLSVKIKAARSGGGDMSQKVNLGYALEGIDAGLEVKRNSAGDLNGKVTLSKDGFSLEVPVSKDGPDVSGAKLKKSWSMDLA